MKGADGLRLKDSESGAAVSRRPQSKPRLREENVASRARRSARGLSWKRTSNRLSAFLYLVPALILMGAGVGYPIYRIILMAFSNVNTFGIRHGFNGLDNFRLLFSSGFFGVLEVTAYWTLGILVPTIIISFVLAYALNSIRALSTFFRSVLIIPWAIPLAIVGIVNSLMLNDSYGQLNTVLLKLHIITKPIGWLARPETALPLMILIGIWVSVPFTTLTLLAGIQAVPSDVREAAKLDGVGEVREARYVVLPLIGNAMRLVILVNLANIFNSFPLIWILTQGGPAESTATVTTFSYQLAFTDGEFGAAGAAAMLSFAALLALAVMYSFALGTRGEGSLM